MYNDAMNITPPPPPSTVRVTVAVTPEVHEAFKRLSKAASMSVSRAMGEWLGDTVEAAEFMATKMEQARAAPKVVMREMHAYALGLADETGDLMRALSARKGGVAGGGGTPTPARPPSRPPSPPPSNTGGKGTKTLYTRTASGKGRA